MKPSAFTFNLFTCYQTLILMLIMFLCVSPVQAQSSKKKQTVRMGLDYFDTAENDRYLTASLFIIENRERLPIPDKYIYFFSSNADDGDLIDSIKTDANGEAKLIFDDEFQFANEESRKTKLEALFKGDQTYRSRSSDVEIAGINMELFLSEVNDQKTVAVRGYEQGQDNAMVPITDASVSFYVPRFLSNQKIGEGDFVNGRCQIEFPENIAGDTIGNISIIARIEDHDYYGNVERKVTNFRWGTTEPIQEDKSLMTIQITIPTRALWHTNAPLWMIITLIVLLTGVWSHYFYVIINLIRMKNLSRKKLKEQKQYSTE